MAQKSNRIIICETCFSIPQIVILSEKNIQIYCNNCKETIIKDYSYFDKFLNKKIDEKLFGLEKCNYNKDHQTKASIYCFKCSKNLCNECIKIHDSYLEGTKHITISQKIKHQYFCQNEGHEEFPLDRYCIECKRYFCTHCNHNHNSSNSINLESKSLGSQLQDEKNIYIFEDNNKKNKYIIKEIKEKIEKCEKIIKSEEEYLKKFLDDIQNKIKSIKNLFEDYKKRNLNIIKIYRLLIDNYEQIDTIRNYNLINNIKINDNFELDSPIIDNSECINSKYNRLCAFYRNKNHIRTTQYANHFMTKKYCDTKFKKCIILNQKIVAFIHDQEKNIVFIFKNEKNEYEMKYMDYNISIKDIYPFYNNKLICFDYSNNLYILNIVNNKGFRIDPEKKIDKVNNILMDLSEKNKFFMIENNKDNFILNYYIDNPKKQEKKTYLLLKYDKNNNIKYIFEDINAIINESKLNVNEIEKLKAIFSCKNENIDNLINKDNELMEYFDTLHKDLYNEFKEKINNNNLDNYIINSNFIFKLFGKLTDDLNKKINNFNLTEEEINKIKYIVNFKNICDKIRETYLSDLVFNSNITKIYNYRNKYILFMGEKFLLNIYSLENKKFLSLTCANLFPNNIKYNNYEIINISKDKILLNNPEKKIIYIIESNDNYDFCLLKKSFNYFSNIVVNDNYLLFDEKNLNNINFFFIDLSNFLNNENAKIIQLLNFKIDNYPQIIVNQNFKKMVHLYENNQLCIMDYNYEDENIEDNKINNGNIMKIKLSKDYENEILPFKHFSSSIYSDKYSTRELFRKESYFCSKTNSNENITFIFKQNYYFSGFRMLFCNDYKKGSPKKFKVTIYDIKQRPIKTYNFVNDYVENTSYEGKLNKIGAYLKFDFSENFGYYYYTIERMYFDVEATYSLKN